MKIGDDEQLYKKILFKNFICVTIVKQLIGYIG